MGSFHWTKWTPQNSRLTKTKFRKKPCLAPPCLTVVVPCLCHILCWSRHLLFVLFVVASCLLSSLVYAMSYLVLSLRVLSCLLHSSLIIALATSLPFFYYLVLSLYIVLSCRILLFWFCLALVYMSWLVPISPLHCLISVLSRLTFS
jgi:hypothetical protein